MSNDNCVDPDIDDEDLSAWEDPAKIAKDNPNFSEGKVRHDIRQRKYNGLEQTGAVLRVGKKHLVHGVRYARWLARQARGAP